MPRRDDGDEFETSRLAGSGVDTSGGSPGVNNNNNNNSAAVAAALSASAAPARRACASFTLGALAGLLIATLAFLQLRSPGSTRLAMGSASDAVFGGALPPSATRSSSPSVPLTASNTPSGTGTASNTPSGTPTGTGTPSNTPSGTPTGTGTATPTPTGTPSSTTTFGFEPPFSIADCTAAAHAFLKAATDNGFPFRINDPEHPASSGGVGDYGRATDTSVSPLTLELLKDAYWQACPPKVAHATYWHYASSTTPDDFCYLVAATDGQTDKTANIVNSWGTQVKNMWVMGATDDAALRQVGVPANAGRDNGRHLMNSIAALANRPDVLAANCKWWVVTGDTAWTNPRVLFNMVRGLAHDVLPLTMGFMWHQHGFVHGVTSAAGGKAIFSRAGWDIVATRAASPACPTGDSLGLPSDDIAVSKCFNGNGGLVVDPHVYESMGALLRNGVPLEPGPDITILQEPINRGGHWASCDNLNAGFVASIWGDYQSVYGPLGLLNPPPAGYTPPTPSAPLTTYSSLPSSAAPCAVRATATLRGLVDATRTSPTSAQPLPIDVAEASCVSECNPLSGPGAADPSGTAGLPHYTEEDICFAVNYGGNAQLMTQATRWTWGWRMPKYPGEAKRRMWTFSDTPDSAANILSSPAFAGLGPSQRAMTILSTIASLGDDVSHCAWWYFLDENDWVNPRTMAVLTAGLHADVPFAIAFYAVNPGGLTVPHRNRVLYSRGAISALAPLVLTPSCPSPGQDGDDALGLARCGWGAGVIPVHTYVLDIANMGPGTDWAFQSPHYLMGWATSWNQGRNGGLLEIYYNSLYASTWNVSRSQIDGLAAGDFGPLPGTRRAAGGLRSSGGMGGEEEVVASKVRQDHAWASVTLSARDALPASRDPHGVGLAS